MKSKAKPCTFVGTRTRIETATASAGWPETMPAHAGCSFGKPGAGRIQWDRFGRIVLAIVIVLLFAAMIKPLWNAVHTYRLAGQTKVRLHQAQAEQAMLQRQLRRASSESTLQREARRLGMIRPEESAWVVNGTKGDSR